MKRQILVIVPAYNEAANIRATLEDIARAGLPLDIAVVNDGSTDQTSAIARQARNVTVIDLPINVGIGAAVQTGILYAARNGYDLAVQFDGDGQHRGCEIPALIAPVLDGRGDVAIGSRFLSKSGGFKSTFARRLGIRIFELVNLLLTGRRITDSTSGFRAYNTEALLFLTDHYPSDFPEPEAVVLLAKNGFRIVEVPAEMRERQGGISSIGGMTSLYYMIKVLVAICVTAARVPVRRAP